MIHRGTARVGAQTEPLDFAIRAGMIDLRGPTPAAAPTYVTDYTAIVTRNADGTVVSTNGTAGRGSFYTFSFETKVPSYSTGSYSQEAVASVEVFTEAQKTLARQAIAAWADASGLTIFEVAEGQGDMKFVKLDVQLIDATAAGFATFPTATWDGAPQASDVYIDSDPNSANWLQLYLHEIGHALGLKHPFEGDIQLEKSVDNYTSTVMSYTPDNDGIDRLGTLDYDAIRFLYGDNSRDGSQVASWNWNAATQTLSQAGFDFDEVILGVGGSDVIYGNAGDDTLQGREGSDQLFGGEGNDKLLGGFGPGLDRLSGENGDDLVEIQYGKGAKLNIDGGAGTDTIQFWFSGKTTFSYDGWAKANPVAGVEKTVLSAAFGEFADRLTGGALDDMIWAGAGNDTVNGGAGNDTLNTAEGGDKVTAGTGDDTVFAGAGNDTASGGTGNDTINGELGDDKLTGEDGDDLLFGGDGADTIAGGAGVDRVNGDAGKDTIDGGDGNDLLYGLADADTVKGGAGDDYLDGGDGDDVIVGGEGADNMWGGNGIDTVSYAGEKAGVTVTINTSRVVGGGNEFLTAIENLTGSAHADALTGDGGDNVLNGADGNDKLFGLGGNDRLIGGAGDDSLDGGTGNDLLGGGAGVDKLKGGDGADRFTFDDGDSGATRATADAVADFGHADKDRIDLSGIDARAGSAADDAFTAIGAATFSGAAGELRFTSSGGVTFVEGDLNGDKVADFALLVTGDKLVATDFIL